MASEYHYDEKGSVRPKPSRQQQGPQQEGERLSPADLRGKPDAAALQRMQRTVGNSAVQRFLAQRQADAAGTVDEESATAINRARGSGAPLDSAMAGRAEAAMGHSFDDVTVHTGAEADRLSRNLGARAFTTGKDIFFREGAYEPGSSQGQELLAHELTHVVQQAGSDPGTASRMTVNDPDDAYEAEADAVAQAVMNQDASGDLQAQPEGVQLQGEEEEELMMQEEEEEELVQMQAEEEEEVLQMQEEEEEELLA